MSDIVAKAREIRKQLESMTQFVPDDKAEDYAQFHPNWSGESVEYITGARVKDPEDGYLYNVIRPHTSQPTWPPHDAPSLFAKVLTSEDPAVVLPWEQPSSTNGYPKGHRAIHKDHIWISLVDNNVWEPGVVGTEALWAIDDN